MSYKVEVKRTGRGGHAIYSEEGRGLRFDWDINMEGAEIYVPALLSWGAFCYENGAGWAQGRRQEILERVAQELAKREGKKTRWRVGENLIIISYEAYWAFRFLNWALGNK